MELLGLSVGTIGISFDDFCRLRPEELEEALRSRRETRESCYRDEWERMRLLATMVMQPHCKNRLKPEKVLPFPWDKKRAAHRNDAPSVSKEEAKARFMKRLGGG